MGIMFVSGNNFEKFENGLTETYRKYKVVRGKGIKVNSYFIAVILVKI